jgi:hypothetical protein
MLTGNRTYTIFWAGSNPNWGDSTNAVPYIQTIQGYFANVAADIGLRSNVYATDTQYYNTSNTHIAYSSTVGFSVTDTTPYPANGCTDNATTICLSDAQLQSELIKVKTNNNWPASSGGVQNLFFIFTPKGVGSCVGSSCAYTSYCAYHSWINSTGGAILYANQPYAAQNYSIYTCDSGQHPNGTTADATLNVVSHEHNEAILGCRDLPGSTPRVPRMATSAPGTSGQCSAARRTGSTTRPSGPASTTSSRSGATQARAAGSPTSGSG